VATALTPAADNRTAMIQNYEYWLTQGKTPEEAQALARAGAGGTTIDMGSGGGKFEEGFAKSDAELLGTVFSTGLQATRNIGRIEQLDQLLQTSPGGAEAALMQFANEIGISTEGGNALTAAQAIINSLVPEQRTPGSGPMSDADLALFKQSLPRIINQPGGNAIIIGTMKAIAQYDAEGAAIVQRMRNGEITRADAFQLLMDRPNPLANFRMPSGATGTGAETTLSPGAESLIEN
jgi:flagellar protein FlgJ